MIDIFHHRHETYVGKFPHLQSKQLDRVSHFNSIGIALTPFFSV
jgi:hypothetical protein